jgi:hypothetical protein
MRFARNGPEAFMSSGAKVMGSRSMAVKNLPKILKSNAFWGLKNCPLLSLFRKSPYTSKSLKILMFLGLSVEVLKGIFAHSQAMGQGTAIPT